MLDGDQLVEDLKILYMFTIKGSYDPYHWRDKRRRLWEWIMRRNQDVY